MASALGAAVAADHDDAVVALADAPGVVDRARGFALVVISDHAQLLAEHAAGLVDLVDGGLDADLDGITGVRERTGQFPRARDAGLGLLRVGGAAR